MEEKIARLCGQLGYPATPGEIAERLRTADGAVFTSDAGWIQVVERRTIESAPHAEIAGLVVDEAHRGRGEGRALVERAAAWARGRGLTRLVVRSNTAREGAHAFYAAMGFERVKTQAVYSLRV